MVNAIKTLWSLTFETLLRELGIGGLIVAGALSIASGILLFIHLKKRTQDSQASPGKNRDSLQAKLTPYINYFYAVSVFALVVFGLLLISASYTESRKDDGGDPGDQVPGPTEPETSSPPPTTIEVDGITFTSFRCKLDRGQVLCDISVWIGKDARDLELTFLEGTAAFNQIGQELKFEGIGNPETSNSGSTISIQAGVEKKITLVFSQSRRDVENLQLTKIVFTTNESDSFSKVQFSAPPLTKIN